MRRLYADRVTVGTMDLSPEQTRHARDVLRLKLGGSVEVFDSAGRCGAGVIVALEPLIQVRIESILEQKSMAIDLTIASAVPKGDRADWLVEKLSELGTTRWIPLQTSRSVVHPEGSGKLDRWNRIAIESAKQCKRVGTMQIDHLTPLARLLATGPLPGYFGSTVPGATSLLSQSIPSPCLVVIGPEGGWTSDEETAMTHAGLFAVTFGSTILRIETAALAAAAMVMGQAMRA